MSGTIIVSPLPTYPEVCGSQGGLCVVTRGQTLVVCAPQCDL